jgi:uncharacterized protein (DUF1697 family)
MKTYIALFRGINVGGNNILPMKELVALLQGIGLQSVKTYIQSGNAVFQSKTGEVKSLAQKIGAAIKMNHGFEPTIWLLEANTLAQAIKSNPYPEAEANTLHLSFFVLYPAQPGPASAGKNQDSKRTLSTNKRCALLACAGWHRQIQTRGQPGTITWCTSDQP